ncbi:MAG: hypothetical protein IKC83_03345 [Clostridia bacterium]|nr:hypothetical protein [Clostridia bacterium]
MIFLAFIPVVNSKLNSETRLILPTSQPILITTGGNRYSPKRISYK